MKLHSSSGRARRYLLRTTSSLIAVLWLAIVACGSNGRNAPDQVVGSSTPEQALRAEISESAVWKVLDRTLLSVQFQEVRQKCVSPDSVRTCLNRLDKAAFGPLLQFYDVLKAVACSGPQDKNCVHRVMIQYGASTEAIGFFDETGWFLTEFRELGVVDLGVAFSPWGLNGNDQFVLLNGPHRTLFPRDFGPFDLRSDQNYRNLIDAYSAAKQGGVINVWPSDIWFESESTSSESLQTFIFQFNVVNGCHACGTPYAARFEFQFTSDGKFEGLKLLEICRFRAPAAPSEGITDCPAAENADP